jgi:hypothetical protein
MRPDRNERLERVISRHEVIPLVSRPARRPFHDGAEPDDDSRWSVEQLAAGAEVDGRRRALLLKQGQPRPHPRAAPAVKEEVGKHARSLVSSHRHKCGDARLTAGIDVAGGIKLQRLAASPRADGGAYFPDPVRHSARECRRADHRPVDDCEALRRLGDAVSPLPAGTPRAPSAASARAAAGLIRELPRTGRVGRETSGNAFDFASTGPRRRLPPSPR